MSVDSKLDAIFRYSYQTTDCVDLHERRDAEMKGGWAGPVPLNDFLRAFTYKAPTSAPSNAAFPALAGLRKEEMAESFVSGYAAGCAMMDLTVTSSMSCGSTCCAQISPSTSQPPERSQLSPARRSPTLQYCMCPPTQRGFENGPASHLLSRSTGAPKAS